MDGIIFSVQLLMDPMKLVLMDCWYHSKTITGGVFVKIAMVALGPINLDFFCDVYPKFCISPSLKVVHVLALDYMVAMSPFLLIFFFTYLLVKMYDKEK